MAAVSTARPHLTYYDPPQPFLLACTSWSWEFDPETGEWKVKRVVAVDDGVVPVNPVTVEGQILGGAAAGAT